MASSNSDLPHRLPVLHDLAKTHVLPDHVTRSVNLVVLQHLLEDTESFVTCLRQSQFRSVTVFGIGYSTLPSVARRLELAGCRVILPEHQMLRQQVEDVLREILEHCRTSDEKLLIHEIGGVCGSVLSEWPDLSGTYCLGAVEDTTYGRRVYESVQGFLPIPVYHVSDTRIKQLEVKHVGEAVANEIQSCLSSLGRPLAGLRCGVIGYGAVGSAVAEALRRRLAHVSVYDIDPVALAGAAVAGFVVYPRDAFLRSVDLLVGATGYPSLQQADVDLLPNGVVLCSASSGDAELPVDYIRAKAKHTILINENVGQVVLPDGRSLCILADGYPVNFIGRSVPDDIIDLVFAEIFLCLRELLTSRLPAGLYRAPEAVEHLVAQRWWEMKCARPEQESR